MNGGQIKQGVDLGSTVGPAWHVEDARDFNGDGTADILWRNDSGQTFLWEMAGGEKLAIGTRGDPHTSIYCIGVVGYPEAGAIEVDRPS